MMQMNYHEKEQQKLSSQLKVVMFNGANIHGANININHNDDCKPTYLTLYYKLK